MKLKTLNEQTEIDSELLDLLNSEYSEGFKAFIETGNVIGRRLGSGEHVSDWDVISKRPGPRQSQYEESVSHITQDLRKWDSRWSEFTPRGKSYFFMSRALNFNDPWWITLNTREYSIFQPSHFCFVKNGTKLNVCNGQDFNHDSSWPALEEIGISGTYADTLHQLQSFTEESFSTLRQLIILTYQMPMPDETIKVPAAVPFVKLDPKAFYKACGPKENGFFTTHSINDIESNREVWAESDMLAISPKVMEQIVKHYNGDSQEEV